MNRFRLCSLLAFAAACLEARLALSPSGELQTGQSAVLSFEADPGLAGQKVTFFDGVIPLGTARIDSRGIASFETVFAQAGERSIHGVVWNSGERHSAALRVTENSGGEFRTPTEYPAGDGASHLALADLNRDSLLDAVVLNQAASMFTILHGQPDGSFGAPVQVATPPDPSSFAVADFDGDGFADIAVASIADGAVSIFYGGRDGRYSSPVRAGVALNPSSLSAADFDGDGVVDLAAASRLGAHVRFFRGDGSRGFGEPLELSAGSRPKAATAVDANGDGIADLALTLEDSGSPAIFTGAGGGKFSEANIVQMAGRTPARATGDGIEEALDADVDNDGRVDRIWITAAGKVAVSNGGRAVAGQDLRIQKSRLDTFYRTATGVRYQLDVSHFGTVATDGSVVSVTDTLPAGMTATAMSGSGWTCTLLTVSCTRSDSLGVLSQYPPIILTVDVGANVALSVTNTANLSFAPDPSLTTNTALLTHFVDAGPDLTISKSTATSFYRTQTGAQYTITVQNVGGGPVPAGQLVTVTDTAIPSGMTATGLSGSGWTCDLLTVSCSRSDGLATGASFPAITLTVTVDAATAASVTNTATVTWAGDPNATNNAGSVTHPVAAGPDLSISKSTATSFYRTQTGAQYTITVQNVGGGPVPAGQLVTVTDTAIPSGMTATGLTGSGWTCDLLTVSCSRSDGLATGGSFPAITLTVTVDAATAASVTNTATVTWAGDPNATNNAGSVTHPVAAGPDLSISKSAATSFYKTQTGAQYTITVQNVGGGPVPAGQLVTVTDDVLPAGIVATGMSGSGWTCDLLTASCSRSDGLAAGGSFTTITLTVNVGPSTDATVTNTATVTWAGDPNATNNSASVTHAVGAGPDLSISKSAATSFYKTQTGAQYTITVQNVGDGPVAAGQLVTVTDTALPAGMSATGMSGSGWTCNLLSVSCTRSDGLANSGTFPAITLTVDVAANTASIVTNTATVTWAGDPNATNNTANATHAVGAGPDLAISKSHTGDFAQGQNGAVYSVVVSNVGSVASTGLITVTDTLPSGLTATAMTGSGWTCTLLTLSCTTNASISAGSAASTIFVTVNVSGSAPGLVTNTATVTGGNDTNNANNSASDPTNVTVAVTVNTSPAGRSFIVDGTPYTSAQVFNWTPGSNHTIATTTPQAGAAGVQYAFQNWSDAGAISHSVTAPAGATTYTANFGTQYQLTTSAGTGGTISPPSGFYDAGNIQISATANSGFTFAGFTGALSGTTNPQTLNLQAPATVAATFNGSTVAVTVNTNPAGRSFIVDGTPYTSQQVFNWTPGSNHTIATTTLQSGGAGVQYVFQNWSDAGAIAHSVTVPAGATTYTANFVTQYQLTTSAGTGGTITPASGFYNAGNIQVAAAPNSGYSFTGFSGALTGATNPQTLNLQAPATVSAAFSQNTVAVTVNTNPAGRSFTVDGTTYTAQQVLNWVPGSNHTIATTTPQSGGGGVQYIFQNWSDAGAISHAVVAPATPTTYTANFVTQYLLTTTAGTGGSISPATGYYNAGNLQISATANSGFTFAGFTGALTGTTNPQILNLQGPATVNASFNAGSTTLSTLIAGKSGPANARVWTIRINNTGAGAATAAAVNSLTLTQQAGTACTPVITSSLPAGAGNIAPGGSATANVTVNFSSCALAARFRVDIGVSANAGAAAGAITLYNQFQ